MRAIATFKILMMITICALMACAKDTFASRDDHLPTYGELDENLYEKGVMRIKLKPDSEPAISAALTVTRGGQFSTGKASFDEVASNIYITEMTPSFREGGKYAERRKKAGLHLWYTVRFGDDQPLTRALNSVSTLSDLVQCVEPIRLVRNTAESDATAYTQEQLIDLLSRNGIYTGTQGQIFDDPLLCAQWNYNNPGILPRSEPGADINVVPAWRLESGKPHVVVAVVDQGIDINHADLRGNIWENEVETNGGPGNDNDNNGYDNDEHGWNFVDDTADIQPMAHATHVAGIIAAINNNGTGIAGIAGGDGSIPGARLMSCQAFDENRATTDGIIAEAIAYAADNGAVICSNSWSYHKLLGDILPEIVKDAIDYFIANAGMDESGTIQTGPVRGGLVLFAAGNDDYGGIMFPGAYEPVVAVAAMATDFLKSTYSNYGIWVDITAPGGEQSYDESEDKPFHQILSTLPDDKYGYMEGTSMAVPHISGVAALIVSRFGGPGFTVDDLREKLSEAVNNIDPYNIPYTGRLGAGYADAFKALMVNNNVPPESPLNLSANWDQTTATVSWTIGRDQNLSTPERYDVMYSERDLTNADFDSPPSGALLHSITVPRASNTGDRMEVTVSSLKASTRYYIAVTAVDEFGLRSEAVMVQGQTSAEPVNRPPTISDVPLFVELRQAQTVSYDIYVHDPEGDTWNYEFVPGSRAVSAVRISNRIRLSFNAQDVSPGEYTAVLIVTDDKNASSSAQILYKILDPNAPLLVQPFMDVEFTRQGEKIGLLLDEYFDDEQGLELAYNIEFSEIRLVNYELDLSNLLTITSRTEGSGIMIVTATNPLGLSRSTYFHITADYSSQPSVTKEEISVYPNPVANILHLCFLNIWERFSFRVQIYNNLGASIMDLSLKADPPSPNAIDVSSLKTGNYTMIVTTPRGRYTRTITKS